ncbi:hypothetical protein QEH52_16705 [Coraliomargarita sp. SDUM461003]|uniref:Uncharacterized protein n=1 Tax=Thalassobacterium maritimum TaxID=3041265 RepID=A0ABU1B0T8_9BACT|nr:hypothetical protein [Coraliomargarita sp. SDUM461003]MDQ8209169.1 hypothetical protein [Coraliomargarita sp. SDUM461003]
MILSLHSFALAAPLDLSGECLLLVELLLPRNGIARKTALKEVRLSKGKASFARAPFYERGLLKEKLDGPVGLKVSITRPLKHPELAQFMRQLWATGLESSGELLSSSLLRYTPFDDVVEEASEQVADRIAEEPALIAEGGLDLDSERLSAGEIRIPLKLLSTLRSSRGLALSQQREKRKSASQTYKKGRLVGEIALHLEL